MNARGKSLLVAYLLWLPPLGLFGAHRFYLGYKWTGAFTLLFGLWIMDIAYLPVLHRGVNRGYAGRLPYSAYPPPRNVNPNTFRHYP